MRRAPIHILLAVVLVFLTSCSDRSPVGPDDQVANPNFSMHLSECWPDDVVGQIEALFPDTGIRVAALAHFDNVLRDVERGALREAETKARAFERFVGNKENKLNDPCGDELPSQDQAETVLIGNVYAIAGGGAPLEVPPEAYEETGGIGLINPVTGGTVLTNNMEAAVVADADAFDGTGLVTIILTRLPDPVVGQPPGSGPIPGYQAYPEGYDILSSRQLTPEGDGGSGAIVELCVVLEAVSPVVEPRLVIGHDLGGTSELLYPRLGTNEVICTDAGGYYPGGEPVALNNETSPWLNLARSVLAPAVSILSPRPLNAMYFAGKGLGGRTKSFSNFAPVDPWTVGVTPESATIDINDEVPEVLLTATLTVPAGDPLAPVPPPSNSDFTWTSSNEDVAEVDANGLVEAAPEGDEGTAIITASYAGLSATSEITVESAFYTLTVVVTGDGYVGDDSESIDCPENCTADFLSGEEVYLWAQDGEITYLDEVSGNCEEGGDPDCTIIMNQDEIVEFIFLVEGPL